MEKDQLQRKIINEVQPKDSNRKDSFKESEETLKSQILSLLNKINIQKMK